MVTDNEKVNDLIQEGIELSSDIIVGIYASKRRKKITALISLLIVLAAVCVVLWKIDFTRIAVAVLIMGVVGLVMFLIHSIKELHGLKRELDALNHYIRN